MARTHTTTTTASFQRPASQFLLKPPPRNGLHSTSISIVGERIPTIPGFKTSAGEYSVPYRRCTHTKVQYANVGNFLEPDPVTRHQPLRTTE